MADYGAADEAEANEETSGLTGLSEFLQTATRGRLWEYIRGKSLRQHICPMTQDELKLVIMTVSRTYFGSQ